LKDYIFDENGGLPAVLSWAVEGAIKLLNSSSTDALGTCKIVSEAAAQYKKNEDRIGIFLEEETKINPEANIGMDDLYLCYKIWSERRGERGLSQIAFDRKLRDRTMEIIGTGSRAIVKGVMLPPRLIQNETIPNIGMSALKYGI
jgi:phage/plasmid-associated DNA primase